MFRVPKLEDLRDLDEVQRIHDDTGAELMVFDNLMLCMSADEPGNVFRMGQTLANVIRICGERGITPLFVHHFRRTRATANQYDPGELLDLTQAGAAETAGQWLLLRPVPLQPRPAGRTRTVADRRRPGGTFLTYTPSTSMKAAEKTPAADGGKSRYCPQAMYAKASISKPRQPATKSELPRQQPTWKPTAVNWWESW